MYEELVRLTSTVGFPIAVCIYLLVRFERKIEALNKSISDLTVVITTVVGNQSK